MTDANQDQVVEDSWDDEDGDGPDKVVERPVSDGPPYEGDDRAKAAFTFVDDLLEQMDMDCDVELRRPKPEEPGEILLEIYGRDAGRIIGKKGQVLSALQYLTNRVVNRPGREKRYVTVDAEGYRARRDDTLSTMAQRLGAQAVTDGKIITFEPMNPRDRRVIHLALAKFEGVVTKSEGEGEDRRVQIIPARR
jgi:spoIIIJ-associated protein